MISAVDSISRRIAGASVGLTEIPLIATGADARPGPNTQAHARRYSSASKAARLCNTFFLAMPPNDALAALQKMGLEKFALEFVTIPAEGGCVVAVFSPVQQNGAFLSKLRLMVERHSVARLLASIGATAISCRSEAGA